MEEEGVRGGGLEEEGVRGGELEEEEGVGGKKKEEGGNTFALNARNLTCCQRVSKSCLKWGVQMWEFACVVF